MKTNNDTYTVVIDNHNKWYDLKLKEVWKYRDLLFLFVKREFTAKYKQTILGPLWAIVSPLLTTIVFTFVFGNLAKLTTADVSQMGTVFMPGFLFYMSGTVCWNYFSGVINGVSNTFIANARIMGKVYYPRFITPLSIGVSGLISFGIQLALFFALLIGSVLTGKASIVVSPALFLVPVVILQMMLLGIGFGIIISSLTTKYRDMMMLVGFGLQLWQYASPVAYGLQMIPKALFGWYLLNPVSVILVTFRYAVFGVGYFNLVYFLVSWVITIVLLVIGLILFNRIEKNFVDTI